MRHVNALARLVYYLTCDSNLLKNILKRPFRSMPNRQHTGQGLRVEDPHATCGYLETSVLLCTGERFPSEGPTVINLPQQ